MENASKALIIAATMLIAVLLVTLFVFLINRINTFTLSKNTIEEQQEKQKFNIPYEKLRSRANYVDNPHEQDFVKGSTMEEILSVVNYTNNVNKTTPNHVELNLTIKTKGKVHKYTAEQIQKNKLFSNILKKEVEMREDAKQDRSKIKYTCKLGYSTKGWVGLVNKVDILVEQR